MSAEEIAQTLAAMDQSSRWKSAYGTGGVGSRAKAALGVRKHGLPSTPIACGGCGSDAVPLGTNMAGHYINRRHGVFDRARVEVADGNPIGIGVPVLVALKKSVTASSSVEGYGWGRSHLTDGLGLCPTTPGLEKGDRSNLPERPGGCCAQIGPVPFFCKTPSLLSTPARDLSLPTGVPC